MTTNWKLLLSFAVVANLVNSSCGVKKNKDDDAPTPQTTTAVPNSPVIEDGVDERLFGTWLISDITPVEPTGFHKPGSHKKVSIILSKDALTKITKNLEKDEVVCEATASVKKFKVTKDQVEIRDEISIGKMAGTYKCSASISKSVYTYKIESDDVVTISDSRNTSQITATRIK